LNKHLHDFTSDLQLVDPADDPNNPGVTWSIASSCNLGPSCQGTLAAAGPTSVSYSFTVGVPVTLVATSNASPAAKPGIAHRARPPEKRTGLTSSK